MKKILVCEDEVSIREFVVINLKRSGYEVVEAGSGEEAGEYDAEKDGVDIALLDIMLPGMDGFAVCRELRRPQRVPWVSSCSPPDRWRWIRWGGS